MSKQSIREGLVVGLIAYVSVAVFYLLFDMLAARGPLYTVDLLGRAVFRGWRDASVLQFPLALDFTAIFWYNAFHLLVSLAIGLVVTSLVFRAERHVENTPTILAVMVAGFVVTVFAVGFFTTGIRPLLPWWSIVMANVFATAAAGLYLVRRHPVWRSLFVGHRPVAR